MFIQPTISPITLAILDNQTEILDGLVFRFSHDSGFKVLFTSPNPDEFPQLVVAHRPNVVIVDLCFDWHKMNFRFDVIEAIARNSPGTKSIVYTGYSSLENCVRAIRAGAMGFVAKDAPISPDMTNIVRIVAAGGQYIEPELDKRVKELLNEPESDATPISGQQRLSRREEQVLELCSRRLQNKQIAQELNISLHTVRATTNNIRQKLGVHSMGEAILIAKARRGDNNLKEQH
ncbi:MAG: response regulator transcription factor [Anaerolineales bacterium]|nr:response regulator transcription factor [Anaerolineales bacterium]